MHHDVAMGTNVLTPAIPAGAIYGLAQDWRWHGVSVRHDVAIGTRALTPAIPAGAVYCPAQDCGVHGVSVPRADPCEAREPAGAMYRRACAMFLFFSRARQAGWPIWSLNYLTDCTVCEVIQVTYCSCRFRRHSTDHSSVQQALSKSLTIHNRYI